MNPLSILLVAIGGYGRFYVDKLLDQTDPAANRITGIVDPFAERCARLDELKALGIPIYETMEEYYARRAADLAIISSPIHFHADHICSALTHGSNVLCEKPLCATIQDARRIIETRDRTGRFVAIGYQWSFSEAAQALKKDIMDGVYGAPIRMRNLSLWPRPHAYYARNDWAGYMRDKNGNWILDSPIGNATAHHLHNIFYLLGDAVDRSAAPARVTAELYRAYDIQNYDTGVARIFTRDGVEIVYVTSHVTDCSRGPEFIYEFENGTVTHTREGKVFLGHLNDGTEKNYSSPSEGLPIKLNDSLEAARGETIPIVCGPEAAASHTLAINGIQESMPVVTEFPQKVKEENEVMGHSGIYIKGLCETLIECYEKGKLPSELGCAWSRPGREVDLTEYESFPSDAFLKAQANTTT